MICPQCSAEVPPEQRFCSACGAPQTGVLGVGGRVLDDETASAEAGSPTPNAQHPTPNTPPDERAERRLVTVLFADISGFTAMSEVLDPEDVREIMNIAFEDVVSAVYRYGGWVDKFIGDAVMALFGAPNAHEDDPERAVATALEMRQAVNAVSQRLADRLPQPLALHVGINTGLVVAGHVGSVTRSDYTVLGDTVNIASRLEDVSENGQIIVAETTHKMTRHAFSYRELPPVKVKGKRQPVPIFELVGIRPSGRARTDVETPFVGRDEELAALTDILGVLAQGSGGLVTIGGPAGVGKSRLLRELRRIAEGQRLRWVQAGTSSLSQGGALTVWADAIRRLLATKGDPEPQGTMMIRKDAAADGPMTMSLEVNTAASLADLLGLKLPAEEHSQLQRLDDSALRERMFLAVRDLLGGEARRQPLVLVLEDLHWADEASFELLEFVSELTLRMPLLFIATYRSDATTLAGVGGWGLGGGEAVSSPTATPQPPTPGLRRHVEVGPLSDEECQMLAAAVLGSDERMAPVRELLVQQAEGNPLYLEEIVRALADQQAIERTTNGGWRLTAEQVEAVLPPSLQGLLLDRIDRLPEGSKRLLQIAAVAGRQFPTTLIAEIVGEGADTPMRLDELVRDGFLEVSQSTGNLRFRQSMMQEAAYSSLLLRYRRSYHRRIAEVLEAQPDLWAVPAELPAVLTNHWERAEEWDRAGAWALVAADQARRAFAPVDASRLYARALVAANHAEDPTLARSALTGLADAALATGDAESALDALDQALALLPAVDSAGAPQAAGVERAALERRRGQALGRLGAQAQALDAYGRAAAALGEAAAGEAHEVTEERATLRVQMAWAQLGRGAVDLARSEAEEVLRLGVGGGDEADALRLLGVIDLVAGDAAAAARRFEAALAVAGEIGDLIRAATLTEQLGLARLQAGDATAGAAHLRDALDRYRRMGDHSGCARCLDELGAEALRTGALNEAIALLREAVNQADVADERALAGRAGLRLGRALGATGAWQAARAALERAGADDAELAGEAALALAQLDVARGGAPESELRATLQAAEHLRRREAADRARIGLATIARRNGRPAEARAYLRAVLDGAPDPNSEASITALVGLAQLAAADGATDAALRVAARALAAAEKYGPATAAWYAQRLYGVVLHAAGRHDTAVRELQAVAAATRAAGALPELGASLSALARTQRSLGDMAGAAETLAELRAVSQAMVERETGGNS